MIDTKMIGIVAARLLVPVLLPVVAVLEETAFDRTNIGVTKTIGRTQSPHFVTLPHTTTD
jgi:hypothetical protein